MRTQLTMAAWISLLSRLIIRHPSDYLINVVLIKTISHYISLQKSIIRNLQKKSDILN